MLILVVHTYIYCGVHQIPETMWRVAKSSVVVAVAESWDWIHYLDRGGRHGRLQLPLAYVTGFHMCSTDILTDLKIMVDHPAAGLVKITGFSGISY